MGRTVEDRICNRRKVVGENDLLEHADRDQGEADREIQVPDATEPPVQLRLELLQIGDGTDDELREEGHEGGIAGKAGRSASGRPCLSHELDEMRFPRIGVCKKRCLVKCIEGNSRGNGPAGHRHMH